MDTDTRIQAFTDALHEVEANGDHSALVELFADSAELIRPASERATPQDAGAFWDSYRSQFATIRTEFTTTQAEGDLAVLEWTSSGQLAAGRDVEYDGVSILTYDGDGRIRRFATYFDSAELTQKA